MREKLCFVIFLPTGLYAVNIFFLSGLVSLESANSGVQMEYTQSDGKFVVALSILVCFMYEIADCVIRGNCT